MNSHFVIPKDGDLAPVVDSIIADLDSYSIVSLQGDLGAGKTALVRAIGEKLGFDEQVNSPTFSIVNEYITSERKTIYHLDLYRLKGTAELLDIGFMDLLAQPDAIVFIEWPEVAKDVLTDWPVLNVGIVSDLEGVRTFSLNSINQ